MAIELVRSIEAAKSEIIGNNWTKNSFFFELRGLKEETPHTKWQNSEKIEVYNQYQNFYNQTAQAIKKVNELAILCENSPDVTDVEITQVESGENSTRVIKFTSPKKTASKSAKALYGACRAAQQMCIKLSTYRKAAIQFINETGPNREAEIAANTVGYAFEGLLGKALGHVELDTLQKDAIQQLSFSPYKFKVVQTAVNEIIKMMDKSITQKWAEGEKATITSAKNVPVGSILGDLEIDVKSSVENAAAHKVILEAKWQTMSDKYLQTNTVTIDPASTSIAVSDNTVRWADIKDSTLFQDYYFENYLKWNGFWIGSKRKTPESGAQWRNALPSRMTKFLNTTVSAIPADQLSYLLQKGTTGQSLKKSSKKTSATVKPVTFQYNPKEKFILYASGAPTTITENGKDVVVFKYAVNIVDVADLIPKATDNTAAAQRAVVQAVAAVVGATKNAADDYNITETSGSLLTYSTGGCPILKLGYSLNNPADQKVKVGKKFSFNMYIDQKYLSQRGEFTTALSGF